jgi:hypothetical protein
MLCLFDTKLYYDFPIQEIYLTEPKTIINIGHKIKQDQNILILFY